MSPEGATELKRRRGRSRLEEGGQEIRRNQVLEAAKYCFKTYGISPTTIRQIAEIAGMSTGHIYNSFGSKTEIMDALAREQTHEFIKMFKDRSGKGYDRENCERYFSLMVDKMLDTDSTTLVVSYMNEALRNNEIRELLTSLVHEFRDELLKVCSAGSPIPQEELEARVVFMMSIFQGLRFVMLFFPNIDKAVLKRVILERLMHWTEADEAQKAQLLQEAKGL